MNFETVIGLEVHCELKTKSKMFSGAPVTFGEAPNTNANIVDMGMTGAMPVLNKSGVEFAIRVCSALNMEIDELVQFDRKNYYYSDLPKGFQITQDRFPIGRNGTMKIEVNGQTQVIEIERLHMEEDTAKQLHFDDYSLIDYNRAGIPLIEIVTKPTIRSGAAAAAYLERLRQIFLFTEVSDAKMEEGSMRCDVNVSIRPYGSEKFGTRTEIKNLNSISNVQKAIDLSGLGLDQIEENDEEFSIGAMVTLRQIELHEGLNTWSQGAVKESVTHIVGVQFRNLATVGGSIFGKFGFSDVLSCFLAFDSYVELHHEGIIPLDQFAANKYPNDILVRLIIKKHPQESVYLSHRNTKTDFPVLTCAVSLGEKEAYAVVGARPSRACRVRLSDQWMEQIKDDEGRRKLADEVTGQMNFGSNMRASAAYREQLSKVLLRRGFEQLEERREK